MPYDAFISYSQAADKSLAPDLRRGLQTLAKPWHRRRALRVFHDTASLDANPNLWKAIRDAMQQSRAFILLASPQAAESPAVGREIEAWREDSRDRRWADRPLLIALTAGEIAWDHAARDFDWTRTTALPRQLSGYFAAEPLWVDLRWAHEREHLSLHDGRFRDSVATLAAAIRHVNKEDIYGEELRQWRRARALARSVAAVLAALLLVSASLGVVASRQRDEARALRDTAEGRALRSQADDLRDIDPALSLRLGVAALAFDPEPALQQDLVTSLLQTHLAGRTILPTGTDGIGLGLLARGGAVTVTGVQPDEANTHDRRLILWNTTDPANPVQAATLPGDNLQLTTVVASRDGNLLAAVGGDSVVLWDITDLNQPRRLIELTAGSGVRSVGFSPDGRTLAAVGWPRPTPDDTADTSEADAGWLALWDLTDPAAPRELARQANVHDSRTVGFTPDGQTLISATAAETDRAGSGATVWDISDRARPTRLARIDNASTVLAVSPTAALLALPYKLAMPLYDLSDPAHPRKVSTVVGPEFELGSVAFSDDGTKVTGTAGFEPTFVWDVTDPAEPVRLASLGAPEEAGLASGFSPDGATVTTVNSGHELTRWRLGDGLPHELSRMDMGTAVTALALNPAGDLLATGQADGTLTTWDVTDPARPTKIGTSVNKNFTIDSIEFNADGTLLAAGGELHDDPQGKGLFRLWDTHDRTHAPTLTAMAAPVPIHTVAFDPVRPLVAVTGGPYAASDGVQHKGWLTILDVTTPADPQTVTTRTGSDPDANAFSPDGRLAVLAGDLYTFGDAATPAPVDMPMQFFGSVTFIDGTTLAVSEGGAGLYDLGDPSLPLPLALNFNDRLLANLGQRVRAYPGGNVLVEVNAAGGLDLWDLAVGAGQHGLQSPFAVPTAAHTNAATDAAVGPAGAWIATSSLDGTVAFWDPGDLPAIVADPAAAACRLAGGGLTRDEWKKYLKPYPYRQLCP